MPDAVTFAARARALAGGAGFAMKPTARLPAAPLPPPSYATSAPTTQMPRSSSRRWIPFALAGLLIAMIAAALVLKRPSPPPASAVERADSGATPLAQPLRVEAPPAAAAGLLAGQREANEAMSSTAIEKTNVPAVRPRPAKVAPVEAPASDLQAVATAPPPAPPAAVIPPPPIAATFEGRRGAEFHVDPEETEVSIDGRFIGLADDWDGAGGGKTYTFPGPGDYVVKLALAGHRTEWVRVRRHARRAARHRRRRHRARRDRLSGERVLARLLAADASAAAARAPSSSAPFPRSG